MELFPPVFQAAAGEDVQNLLGIGVTLDESSADCCVAPSVLLRIGKGVDLFVFIASKESASRTNKGTITSAILSGDKVLTTCLCIEEILLAIAHKKEGDVLIFAF